MNFKTSAIIIIIFLGLPMINLQGEEILFKTDFKNKAKLSRWKVTDYGKKGAKSEWQIIDGAYVQTTNIQRGGGTYVGTTSVTGKLKWSNYILDAKVKSTDNDILGIMFYYTDEDNYYRLRLMGDDDIYKEGKVLEKVVNGKWTKLAISREPYTDSNWHRVRIVTSNNRIIVYYDDLSSPVFNVQDSSHSRGKIGLFSWANKDAYFDNIKVYTMPYLVNFTNKSRLAPLNMPVSIKVNVNNISSKAARFLIRGDSNIKIVSRDKTITVNKGQSAEKEFRIKGSMLGKGNLLVAKENGEVIGSLELLVTKKENLNLKIYFGDFHIHTTYSDGKNTPYEMVLQAKRVGLDVIAITDHLTTKGAAAGKRFVENYKPRMVVINGEENHKVIDFKSVLKRENIDIDTDDFPYIFSQAHLLVYNHPEGMETLTRNFGKKFAKDPYKLLRWAAGNNILVYQAHPTSIKQPGTDEEKMVFLNNLLKNRYIIGFENRATKKTENSSYQYYHTQLKKGNTYPILANTDAHSTKGLGRVRTIVLAESLDEKSILKALKTGKTVVMNKNGKLIDGPPHLVELVKMYLDDFLPIHNEYAKEEAEILRHIHGGHTEMKKDLDKMKHKWKKLYQKFFPEQ